MINGTACYLRRGGQTLFLNRNRGEGDIHNGLYVPPGGQYESGERGIDCVVREVSEETSLVVINPKLKVIATFDNRGRLLGGKMNPEDWIVEFYLCNEFTGELKAESPKAIPMWVDDSAISNYRMHEGDRRIMDLLGQEGIFQVVTKYDVERLVLFDSLRVA